MPTFDTLMIGATESMAANKLMVAMIQADPENAAATLQQVGYTPEEAQGILDTLKGKIKYHVVQESLELFRRECTTIVSGVIPDLPALDEYGDASEIEEVVITIRCAREIRKLDSGAEEIGDMEWGVKTLTRPKGGKLTGDTTKRKPGGGSRSRVPFPEHLKSDGLKTWKAKLERDYPARYKELEGRDSNYAATRELKALGDTDYLAALGNMPSDD